MTVLGDETGAGTAWWVLWMIGFMVLGGAAVDSSNAWRMRAELQATADAAAHAGVIDLPDQVTAAASATEFAATNMNPARHGQVLDGAEIEFGMWDAAASAFVDETASPPKIDAIRITTRRDGSNANRLKTSFLRLVGMDSWNVSAQAVAQRYFPDCTYKEGIIAREIVDFQSNNHFYPGICIHGNDHVELQNGNTWDPGVSVTMPNIMDLVTPSSDLDVHNPGLIDALGEEYLDPKIVDRTDEIIMSLTNPNSPFVPDYIDKTKPVIQMSSKDFDSDTLLEGRIYYNTCPERAKVSIDSGSTISNVVIISNCRIEVGSNSVLTNVILGARGMEPLLDIDKAAIGMGSGVQLGADDNCAPGGGVVVISNGSTASASNMQYHGVQVIAGAHISLAAQASGIEGILLQAGGRIDITSNASFGGCTGGVDRIAVPYFRLVL